MSFTIRIKFQTIFSYSNWKMIFFLIFFLIERHLHILLKRSDLLLVTNVKLALKLIDIFSETLSSDKTSETLHI